MENKTVKHREPDFSDINERLEEVKMCFAKHWQSSMPVIEIKLSETYEERTVINIEGLIEIDVDFVNDEDNIVYTDESNVILSSDGKVLDPPSQAQVGYAFSTIAPDGINDCHFLSRNFMEIVFAALGVYSHCQMCIMDHESVFDRDAERFTELN